MVYLVLFVLGLCLGSFVNAFVWRRYRQSKSSASVTDPELSIIRGRSMCPNCRHKLAWYDLLPIISWTMLKGRCRYCHRPISWQYPAVELLTSTLFVCSYAFWAYGLQTDGQLLFAAWLIMLSGLMILAVYDLKWMLLPTEVTVYLTVFWVLVLAAVAYVSGDWASLSSAVLGGGVCLGLFGLIYLLPGKRLLGLGDVILAPLLGLLAGGILPAIAVIFLGSLIGLIAILPQLLTGKLKPTSRVPFGPSLVLSAAFVFIFHDTINRLTTTYILPF